jgi:hypothetical protein
MDILNPPKAYVDYRCAVYGLEGAMFESAENRFYKNYGEGFKEEICKFFNWLNKARQDRILPFEHIEIRDYDEKKH